MMFLNPIGWLFLGLVPVVVALYLRRVRRREVAVPTLLFWRLAMGEQRHRAFLGRLRQWLSLLLALLILLLLVLALVRPELKRIAASGESTVIVLDARARMQALEPGGGSRFGRALELARRRAAGAREGNSVAVLTAGPETRVVSAFSEDATLLRERLQKLTPTDAPGDLAPSLALARELLATRPGAHRILLLTDRPAPAPKPAPARASEKEAAPPVLEVVAVGSPRDNVAITRFAARAQLASPQTADLLLSLANFGEKPARGSVEIACDGALLDVRPFSLAPGERRSDVFPALPATGASAGRLSARLKLEEGEDALPLDNTARTLLPAARLRRVLLVTAGNWFLEKLFASDPAVQFELLAPGNFHPEMARGFDVVVYDDCGPTASTPVSAPASAPGAFEGNALFLKSSPLGSTGVLKEPLVTDSDADSPLLRFVQWRNVTLLRAVEITPPRWEGWEFQAPLRSFQHPLILAGTQRGQPGQPGRRMAVFAFDVAESDLPLRVAFPLLMSNTLQWLAEGGSGGSGGAPGNLECGRAIALGEGETVLWGEEKDAGALPAPAPQSGAFQPLRDGFYRLEGAGAPPRSIAVNTFSETESDLRGPSAAAPRSGGAAAAPPAPGSPPSWLGVETIRPPWQWLALAAFALLGLEWGLFHRRRTE